jgi:hypothetical protein
MSEQLHAGIAGFDFTPPIHPEYGAWGTTPSMTEVDLPLLGRCLALRQGSGQGQQADQLVLWFALDLCGNPALGPCQRRCGPNRHSRYPAAAATAGPVGVEKSCMFDVCAHRD